MQDLRPQSRSTLLTFPLPEALAAGFPTRSGEPLCDAGVVLQRCLPLLQAQIAGAAQIQLRMPRHMPPLPLSGEALERLAASLISHAARTVFPDRIAEGTHNFAGPAGTVWVVLLARDGAARLTVEANGAGQHMSTRAATRLQPGDDESDAQGSLHSPDAFSLLAETGGRLVVRPRPGAGAVFAVTWTLPDDGTLPGVVRHDTCFCREAAAAC